jgi:hypothetical protein
VLSLRLFTVGLVVVLVGFGAAYGIGRATRSPVGSKAAPVSAVQPPRSLRRPKAALTVVRLPAAAVVPGLEVPRPKDDVGSSLPQSPVTGAPTAVATAPATPVSPGVSTAPSGTTGPTAAPGSTGTGGSITTGGGGAGASGGGTDGGSGGTVVGGN